VLVGTLARITTDQQYRGGFVRRVKRRGIYRILRDAASF